jgi:hypothetical protein
LISIAVAQSAAAQQRTHAGFACPAGHEQVHGVSGTALLENLIQEFQACLTIEYPVFLAQRLSVAGQDFGPFVAVVPGAVITGKNMRETVRKAVAARCEVAGQKGYRQPGFAAYAQA